MFSTERDLRSLFVSIARLRLDEEAYKWSSARFYRDLWRPNDYVDWPDNPYNTDKWFGSDLTTRIYLKFGNEIDKTETEIDIEAKLDEAGYEIVDYDKNRCRKKGDKPENQPKISGILAKIDATGKLVNKFNRDAAARKGRIANPEVDGKMVVVSRHPYDVAGMTTGRKWSGQSCMRHDDPANQSGGCYHPAVISDILRGTLVAFFTDEDDTNIENPIARLLIKPYYTKTGQVYLRQSTRCYPLGDESDFPPQARQALKKWLTKQQGDLTDFAYFKNGSAEHSSSRDPIRSNMSKAQMMAIINRKVQAGLYLDQGDTASIPPDVPSDEVLNHLDQYEDGAKMVASWVENQHLDIDSPYMYVPDGSGKCGIFEYVKSRRRVKSVAALKFVYHRESVLGASLKVAWETDIPRYLAVIQKNPEMLLLPTTVSSSKPISIASYLLTRYPIEFMEILNPVVLAYLSDHESETYAEMMVAGLVPPADPRWYLGTNERTGYSNAYTIFTKRHQDLSVLEEMPEEILNSPRLLNSITDNKDTLFVDLILQNMSEEYTASSKYPKLVNLVTSVLASSRTLRARRPGGGQVRIFWLLHEFANAYLPRLLDLYGQDAEMLRMRNVGADVEKTVAHEFAEVESRWIPRDKAILRLEYLDPARGKSVSVLDTIQARKGKVGRYLQGSSKTESRDVLDKRGLTELVNLFADEDDDRRESTLKALKDPRIRKLLGQATDGHFHDLEVDDRGYVNYQGDINLNYMRLEKIPVPFGTVGGYFDCSRNQLQTLEGAPTSVGRSFDCSYNQLQTLEGAPESVGGYFECSRNQLTSLQGAPASVGGDFYCHHNRLTSLQGAPESVGGDFYCHRNQLQTLEGAPESMGGGFSCPGNQLQTLEGAPKSVGGEFDCSNNQLQTLEGAPTSVGGNFNCSWNQLQTLEGAPASVGGNFDCLGNQLTSLQGAPESVGGTFNCSGNQLTSLQGAPESVGGYFDCSGNPDLPREESQRYRESGAVRFEVLESRGEARRYV